ncbi:MAG TPA: hypothetical protein VGE11_20875 [Pseudonocardia sp.]
MSQKPTAQQGAVQATPPAPVTAPPTAAPDQPVPTNRAARRRKGKGIDPATAAEGYHGSAGRSGPARTTAQGRRVNPVRRSG